MLSQPFDGEKSPSVVEAQTFYSGLHREEFPTYEREITRLETLSGMRTPNMLGGARDFLGSLNGWVTEGEDPALDRTVVVSPDPAWNLSLPYPADELALALTSANKGNAPTQSEIDSLAQRFGIAGDLLERPTTALSGGERMLVSLAKAFALSASVERVCLCSPYFWLDVRNRSLITDHFSTLASAEAHLLVLSGEDDASSGESSNIYEQPTPLTWHLEIDEASVVFPAQSFPRVTAEKEITFVSDSTSLVLKSPTLITGRNGVGKTTLAKLLAHLIEPERGSLRAITNGLSGPSRLLLQDTVIHLFGKPISEHLGRVFCFDREAWKEARKVYDAIQRKCLSKISVDLPGIEIAASDRPRSMLQCKIAVAVDRLLSSAPLLILDEPGWCLSRTVGRVFVESIVAAAHERGIAVAIISHQSNWWRGLIGDELRIEPVDAETVRVSQVGELRANTNGKRVA